MPVSGALPARIPGPPGALGAYLVTMGRSEPPRALRGLMVVPLADDLATVRAAALSGVYKWLLVSPGAAWSDPPSWPAGHARPPRSISYPLLRSLICNYSS